MIQHAMIQHVHKDWGYEIWFANNDKYCGKFIHIDAKKWSSHGKFHYHRKKDETFFITEGILILDIGYESDPKEGYYKRHVLRKHDSFRVRPLVKHRFYSDKGCDFVEASTTHREEDSYRCYWNGSLWVAWPAEV